jgi:signal transduction histidine kinase
MAAAIIRCMLDINHRMVVEQHGGDIRYTSQPSDIGFHVRLPMDGSIDGEAPRIVVRLPAVG